MCRAGWRDGLGRWMIGEWDGSVGGAVAGCMVRIGKEMAGLCMREGCGCLGWFLGVFAGW